MPTLLAATQYMARKPYLLTLIPVAVISLGGMMDQTELKRNRQHGDHANALRYFVRIVQK